MSLGGSQSTSSDLIPFSSHGNAMRRSVSDEDPEVPNGVAKVTALVRGTTVTGGLWVTLSSSPGFFPPQLNRIGPSWQTWFAFFCALFCNPHLHRDVGFDPSHCFQGTV